MEVKKGGREFRGSHCFCCWVNDFSVLETCSSCSFNGILLFCTTTPPRRVKEGRKGNMESRKGSKGRLVREEKHGKTTGSEKRAKRRYRKRAGIIGSKWRRVKEGRAWKEYSTWREEGKNRVQGKGSKGNISNEKKETRGTWLMRSFKGRRRKKGKERLDCKPDRE